MSINNLPAYASPVWFNVCQYITAQKNYLDEDIFKIGMTTLNIHSEHILLYTNIFLAIVIPMRIGQ
jgi:hypothetical protein